MLLIDIHGSGIRITRKKHASSQHKAMATETTEIVKLVMPAAPADCSDLSARLRTEKEAMADTITGMGVEVDGDQYHTVGEDQVSGRVD